MLGLGARRSAFAAVLSSSHDLRGPGQGPGQHERLRAQLHVQPRFDVQKRQKDLVFVTRKPCWRATTTAEKNTLCGGQFSKRRLTWETEELEAALHSRKFAGIYFSALSLLKADSPRALRLVVFCFRWRRKWIRSKSCAGQSVVSRKLIRATWSQGHGDVCETIGSYLPNDAWTRERELRLKRASAKHFSLGRPSTPPYENKTKTRDAT